jgi:hypothetical protein
VIVSLWLAPIWSVISVVLEVTTRVTSSVLFYKSHHLHGAVICIIFLGLLVPVVLRRTTDCSDRSFLLL